MLHVLGCITQQHDLRLVVLAGVLCLFACVTAMSLVARARASRNRTRRLWLAGAGLVAGCGIWGAHFVAMLDPATLAVAVAAIAILIMALGLVGSLVDSHLSSRAQREAERLRAHVLDLEATRERLEQTSENLRLALETAAAANKAKSAFLAAMSHELRTPLNAVIGFSDMLMAETFGTVGSDRNKEYVKDIHSSGRHLLSLINDILDIARIDAGQYKLREETLDPEEIITDCLRMVTPQANAAGVGLERVRGPDIPLIRGDERRLKQVLINLLGNALKFTRAGGHVTVLVQRGAQGISFSVRDTGIGMAEKDIPIALERFGQVDSTLARKYEGAGLGLPISKHLAELHGGTLAIESALGVGTIVSIFIPAERFVARAAALAARA